MNYKGYKYYLPRNKKDKKRLERSKSLLKYGQDANFCYISSCQSEKSFTCVDCLWGGTVFHRERKKLMLEAINAGLL